MFGMKKEKKLEGYGFEDFLWLDLTPENVDLLYRFIRYSFIKKREYISSDLCVKEVNIFGDVINKEYPPVPFSISVILDHNAVEGVKYLFGQLQAIHLGKDATSTDAMRAKFMGGPTGIVWADEEHTKELYELMYLGVGTGLIAPLREVTLKSGKQVIAVDLKHAKAKEIFPCISKETIETFPEIFGDIQKTPDQK